MLIANTLIKQLKFAIKNEDIRHIKFYSNIILNTNF